MLPSHYNLILDSATESFKWSRTIIWLHLASYNQVSKPLQCATYVSVLLNYSSLNQLGLTWHIFFMWFLLALFVGKLRLHLKQRMSAGAYILINHLFKTLSKLHTSLSSVVWGFVPPPPTDPSTFWFTSWPVSRVTPGTSTGWASLSQLNLAWWTALCLYLYDFPHPFLQGNISVKLQ